MSVSIRWERADDRRHMSVSAPLFVVLDSVRCRASSWSLGGLEVEQFQGTLPSAGQVVALRITLPFQGFEMSFPASARIVARDDGRRAFTAEFAALGNRERELMRHFLDELICGSMAGVEDTIQRIDVPVAPLSLTPDAAPAGPRGDGRHPRLASLVYGALGLLVFGYLGFILSSRLSRIEVDSAVLATPIEAIASQAEGHVIATGFKPGDKVLPGDVIARLYDNQLERDIEQADIAVQEREARLTNIQKRAEEELAALAATGAQSVARTKLEIESIGARLQAAEQEARRVATDPGKLSEARKKILAYQKSLEVKRLELSQRLEASLRLPRAALGGRPGAVAATPLDGQVAQATQDLEFASRRLQSLTNHRDRLAVRASVAGLLAELPHADGASVRKGDIVAIVEQSTMPHVTAYVSQSDVVRLRIGDKARLFVPALGEHMSGRIAAIDRAGVRVGREADHQIVKTHSWRGPTEHWAKVEVQLDGVPASEDRLRYHNGLPTVVQFQKRWSLTSLAGLPAGLFGSFSSPARADGQHPGRH